MYVVTMLCLVLAGAARLGKRHAGEYEFAYGARHHPPAALAGLLGLYGLSCGVVLSALDADNGAFYRDY